MNIKDDFMFRLSRADDKATQLDEKRLRELTRPKLSSPAEPLPTLGRRDHPGDKRVLYTKVVNNNHMEVTKKLMSTFTIDEAVTFQQFKMIGMLDLATNMDEKRLRELTRPKLSSPAEPLPTLGRRDHPGDKRVLYTKVVNNNHMEVTKKLMSTFTIDEAVTFQQFKMIGMFDLATNMDEKRLRELTRPKLSSPAEPLPTLGRRDHPGDKRVLYTKVANNNHMEVTKKLMSTFTIDEPSTVTFQQFKRIGMLDLATHMDEKRVMELRRPFPKSDLRDFRRQD
ncbi:uncharacterized protein LOC133635728 [Entelurus aequoreus]|uniref:uncharacterized protein LOC133635728 n=1 Tax=Entelurus aequoreus TaxID=161455 RepID=UPI002B1E1D6E|nr:uncharacterized protein LOC133635728 [Entelurus aequoreus]